MLEARERATRTGESEGRTLETLRLKFPSEFAEARKAQDQVISTVARYHYDDESVFAIKLALEEAVINAIKHGNRFDKKKTVELTARIGEDRVEIEIEDQGQGFDRRSVPDPLADENIERLHGRGLLLMEAYMNSVEYSNGGRRVRLVRLKDAPPSQQPAA